MDYRALNTVTISDKYPLPNHEDLTDHLEGEKLFSSLDLEVGTGNARLQKTPYPSLLSPQVMGILSGW